MYIEQCLKTKMDIRNYITYGNRVYFGTKTVLSRHEGHLNEKLYTLFTLDSDPILEGELMELAADMESDPQYLQLIRKLTGKRPQLIIGKSGDNEVNLILKLL